MIHPPAITEADVLAVQAVLAGVGSADQQQRAIGWIIREACQFSNVAPDDASDRQANYLEGRRMVGFLILQMKEKGVLEAAKRRDAEKRQTPLDRRRRLTAKTGGKDVSGT